MNEELEENEPLVNLASNEYFSALMPQKIKAPVYKIIFKDFKNGKYKFIQFFTKKARGLLARFIIEMILKKHQILYNSIMKAINSSKESSKDTYVFLTKKNPFKLDFLSSNNPTFFMEAIYKTTYN